MSQFLGKRSRSEPSKFPDAGSNKPHLFEVDKVTHVRLIANMEEVGIFSDEGHKRNDRRGKFALQ